MTNLNDRKLLNITILEGHHPLLRLFYRRILLSCLVLLLSPDTSYGGKVLFGITSMEEGDDRQRPAISLALEWENLILNSYYYGQDIDRIRSRSHITSLGYSFPYMKLKWLRGSIGPSYMKKSMTLPIEDFSAASYSFESWGLALGLYWSPWSPLWRLSWESHLYPAGYASLLLTTARRQSISVQGGWAW